MEKTENTGVDVQRTATEEELEQVAGGSGPYLKNECHICGAYFRNSKELKAHLRVAHPNDPRARLQ